MIIGKKRLFLKLFITWDSRLLRLGRLVWAKGKPGEGGYSAKISLALTLCLLKWHFDRFDKIVTVFGIRIHYQKHFGGWIT